MCDSTLKTLVCVIVGQIRTQLHTKYVLACTVDLHVRSSFLKGLFSLKLYSLLSHCVNVPAAFFPGQQK